MLQKLVWCRPGVGKLRHAWHPRLAKQFSVARLGSKLLINFVMIHTKGILTLACIKNNKKYTSCWHTAWFETLKSAHSKQKVVDTWCRQCGRGQCMRWSVIADEIKASVVDKLNCQGTQSWTCVVDERCAKNREMVPRCRRSSRFQPKPNYYFCPIYNVPWKLHTNSPGGICIKATN